MLLFHSWIDKKTKPQHYSAEAISPARLTELKQHNVVSNEDFCLTASSRGMSNNPPGDKRHLLPLRTELSFMRAWRRPGMWCICRRVFLARADKQARCGGASFSADTWSVSESSSRERGRFLLPRGEERRRSSSWQATGKKRHLRMSLLPYPPSALLHPLLLLPSLFLSE